MQITITEAEIKSAIDMFARSKINLGDGQSFKIDLKATRGAEGYTAELEILDNAEETPVTETAPTPAPKEVKPSKPFNKLKPEPEAEVESEEDKAEVANDDAPAPLSAGSIFSKAKG